MAVKFANYGTSPTKSVAFLAETTAKVIMIFNIIFDIFIFSILNYKMIKIYGE